jgi:hypothetical protein
MSAMENVKVLNHQPNSKQMDTTEKMAGIDRHPSNAVTLQYTLYEWYNLFNEQTVAPNKRDELFSSPGAAFGSLVKTMEDFPNVLMKEFIIPSSTFDKQSYIHIIQALLTNISDKLYNLSVDDDNDEPVRIATVYCCKAIQKGLDFLRNFFYSFFDNTQRLPVFCNRETLNSVLMKFSESDELADYLKIYIANSSLSYHQADYLTKLAGQIQAIRNSESADNIIHLLYYNNYNNVNFIESEKEKIRKKSNDFPTGKEKFQFCQNEINRISIIKIKPQIAYNISAESIKKQLLDWLKEEIKQLETEQNKVNLKDAMIDTENKIQTTLSVAKLAVLLRLMTVDKIIINQPITAALRTASKVFSTLQKDEISFGSLETKYHAPDKSTITNVKEMLTKWVKLTDKL